MRPELSGKIGIQMDPKRLPLSEIKLVSRDKMLHIPCETYTHMFH